MRPSILVMSLSSWLASLKFGTRLHATQAAEGLLGAAAVVDDGVDLLGDRQRDAVLAPELDDRARGLDALGDHVHAGLDLLDAATARQLLADAPVAAERAHACRHQIAEAGEPGERRGIAAHGDAEAGDL